MVVFLLLCLVVGLCGWGTIFSVLGWILFVFGLIFVLCEMDWVVFLTISAILLVIGGIVFYNMYRHDKNYEKTGICDFRIHGEKYYARHISPLYDIIDEDLYKLIQKDMINGKFQNWDERAKGICRFSNYVVPKDIFYKDEKDILRYIRTHNCEINIECE